MNKKGDLKIQEMAFVLLAIVLLGSLVVVFAVRFQSEDIVSGAEALRQKRALALRDKIASLPELSCARKSCIDKTRAEMIKNYDVEDLFQGLVGAKIAPVYPEGEEIILYDSGKSGNATYYSTFINLCEQVDTGVTFEYDCGLAMLLVGI